ncbi:MAG TPA: outer membrane lipoprotein carrier protein LolA [Candidatus Sulfopaludibacter sp.]|jgi:outer membrane lipoprotein-sorting protein|nr:outer membrane lipoprotein carrier protein LolA [Candidatus Sulfopaludibacter sp.]
MRYLPHSLVLLGAVALLAALSSAAPAADDLAAVYAKIDAAAPGFRGFSADLKRVKVTPVVPEPDVQTGKAVVRRAKPHELQMRISFDPPDQQTISADATKVEIYYPKTNTILPYELSKSSKPMIEQVMMLGWGSTSQDLRNAYDITYGGPDTVDNHKTARLVLIAKDKGLAAQIPKFELWIPLEGPNTGVATQVKIYEKGGDYTLATYTNMKLGSISESDVKLNAPRNAKREKPTVLK